jgi:hypothetical protein
LFEEVLRNSGTELFALITHEVDGYSEVTDLKMMADTVVASLLGKATSWTYFVKVSMMHKMNF